MKKEVKIEDFIGKDELDVMTEKEREIYEKTFLMHKQNIQGLTDALDMVNDVVNNIKTVKSWNGKKVK